MSNLQIVVRKSLLKEKELKTEVPIIVEVKKEILDDITIKEKPKDKPNPQAKKVYAYEGRKCVGVYDSITICASMLGMSRAMVKKAIESGTELTNGFKLKLK